MRQLSLLERCHILRAPAVDNVSSDSIFAKEIAHDASGFDTGGQGRF
jgi:hypothetical protein